MIEKFFAFPSKRCPSCNSKLDNSSISSSFKCDQCGVELTSNNQKINLISIVVIIISLPIVLPNLPGILAILHVDENNFGVALGLLTLFYGLVYITLRNVFLQININSNVTNP